VSARSRLATLLGGHFPDLTAHQMRRLVDNAVREDVDLDFKETRYGKRDSEKRDLAGDVAALANTLGGALILGLKDEDGMAVGDPGVPLSDAEEQRIHLILASNVAPHIGGVHIRRIERTKGEGFYVIEVLRSTAMPHAVRVGNALRYPRRLGTTIHWLSETEVADAYRNRFAAATAQVDRLNDVYVDGMAGLGRNGWSGQDPWVAVALMPDLPEDLVINLAQIIDALVEHAVDRSGASGLGVVRAGIEARDDVARPMPSLLVHQRGDFPFMARYEGQHGVAEVPTSDHTVDLDAIRARGPSSFWRPVQLPRI
jgi:Schlafen, AlbA_2